MTKAKTAKSSVEAKKSAKPAVKPAAKAKKAGADKPKAASKPEKKAPQKAVAAREAAAEKVARAKAAAPASKAAPKEKKPAAAPEAREVKAPAAPAEEARAVAGFSNSSGLGIKTASKKPGLSVAPGVMILGRAAQPKTEQCVRPSERRLSKKEQGEIKNFLLERRERLLAGMRRELAMQKERAESKAADEVDKATDAYDEDLSFEIATANDQELEEIQVALEKIERGTYGECEICGCAISPSRLKILPSASTCVSCRGQEEQARRRDEGAPTFSMIAGEEGESESEPM